MKVVTASFEKSDNERRLIDSTITVGNSTTEFQNKSENY